MEAGAKGRAVPPSLDEHLQLLKRRMGKPRGVRAGPTVSHPGPPPALPWGPLLQPLGGQALTVLRPLPGPRFSVATSRRLPTDLRGQSDRDVDAGENLSQ